MRTGLGVVLAEERIISSDETNDTLLSFVANIDSNKHCLGGNVFSKVHSPEITTKLGINLSHNVEVDSIIVSVDGLAGDELRDDWVVRVNLIFNGCVEVLLTEAIRDDHQEELDNWLRRVLSDCSWACLLLLSALLASVDIILEVGVNGVLKILNLRFVMKRNDVSIVDENVQTVLL